jgi:uncharacterized membrane protein SirB2
MWYSSQGRMADHVTETVLVDSGVMVFFKFSFCILTEILMFWNTCLKKN